MHGGAFEPTQVPGDFIAFAELEIRSAEHRLGYFGNDPLLIVGYCARGGEVIWKDGHRSGFGAGGWKMFLDEISPMALRHGIHLGSIGSAGTHVLLIDRQRHRVYAAPRESAERFLCRHYGLEPPTRRCLCGVMDCAACSAPAGDQVEE
jgi:hypothetical protein